MYQEVEDDIQEGIDLWSLCNRKEDGVYQEVEEDIQALI